MDWVPLKSKQMLEKQASDLVKSHVNDPHRVARAQEKAGITIEAINVVLKEVLPEGRGWRPTAARVIQARKTRTSTMQRVLPIWGTAGEGHFVSLKRQLQLLMPFYCAQVEDMGYKWDMVGLPQVGLPHAQSHIVLLYSS
eukprot:TRINITY_DN3809_c0_g1_i1.p1 TRINITY_DN3809_c0_g1~~TRINITY_DN3809_c0_g1_i1.p1  ORF type:complete len:156 (-),score=17.66 TRINITY_DN3809_c0_g1_i1:209-628(-)